jgi:hypothetical protein
MKITLDLPEWVDERNVRVFAGIELVARHLVHGPGWEIKTHRCSQCGRCCADLGPNHPFHTIDRQCVYLVKQPGKDNPRWDCALGVNRPFGCSAATPYNDFCSVRFKPSDAKYPGAPDAKYPGVRDED